MLHCRTDGKTIHKKKETQMTHGWIAWVRLIALRRLTSLTLQQQNREADIKIFYIYEHLAKIWMGHPQRQDPGTRNRKMSERYAGAVAKRCWNRIHPNKCQEAIEWSTSSWHKKGSFSGLSTNWAEYFADEKQTLTDQPSSLSSTWTPSSSWWDSPSWTQTGTHGTSAIGKTDKWADNW